MTERIEYDLDEIPEEDRVYSQDRRRVAAFYIARETSDRFDDDTFYEIRVWETATKAPVRRFGRSHTISHSAGTERGGPVTKIEFSDDGTELVIHHAGEVQREPLP